MNNLKKLPSAIKYALFVSAASLAGNALAQDTTPPTDETTTTLDRVQVTGSRIKRADVEGALPMTVISREDIEVSGKVSVAEVLQTSTFNSFGSFKPASGSSAQSFSELSLRGMGGGRTLILIDGRRAPISPQTGEAQDLNSLPLAAVERIEILSDGASAIYGADAIAGVVNIITRKDFNGGEVSLGKSISHRGGDTESGSAILGASGDRGRMLGGVSYATRGINFVRDLEWVGRGASSYGNNYYNFALDSNGKRAPTSKIGPVPGGCTNPGFYLNNAGTTCQYDYNLVAADTASIEQSGAFAKGDFQINDDWLIYMNASVTRVESFGRFAPTPEFVFLGAASPNNTTGKDVLLKHRFAALGPRDNFDDTNVYDFNMGFNWQATDSLFLDFGLRRAESRFVSHGYNYVNIPVATTLFNSGAYNVFNPIGNTESVLNQIRTTTSRDGFFKQSELYALANLDLWEMGGGTAGLAIGAEYREEDYADIYDQQSAAGNVGGSSGNSSFGKRDQTSVYGELLLPITDMFELDLAVRHDRFSDYGNATTPKISFRFQPLDNLTLRASYGEGFRAPPLSILNSLDAFSADSVVHGPTADQLGVPRGSSIQINGLRVAAPNLLPEESKQWSAGVVWDPTDWMSLRLDHYNIEVDNQHFFYSAQTVINREDRGQYLPAYLYSLRDPATGALIQVRAGYGNEGKISTNGFDFSGQTRFDMGTYGSLRTGLNVSYVNSYEVANPVTGTSTEFVGQPDVPKWRANLQNSWEKGDFSINWTVNAFDQTRSDVETLLVDDYGYTCQQVVDYGYTNSCSTSVYFTHDLSFTYKTPWNGKVTLGALNLTNRDPRIDTFYYTPGYNPSLYDAYGRQVYMRYTQNF